MHKYHEYIETKLTQMDESFETRFYSFDRVLVHVQNFQEKTFFDDLWKSCDPVPDEVQMCQLPQRGNLVGHHSKQVVTNIQLPQKRHSSDFI